MSSNKTVTISYVGAVNNLDYLSPTQKFWLYLIFLIPSTILTLFVLYQLLFDRLLRKSLHNHVIIILMITVVICQITIFPWMLYYFYNGNYWHRPVAFCLIWGFIDWPVYILQLLLFAWASIERHILIFNDQLVSTHRKRVIVHYLPLIILTGYWFIFYIYVYFMASCNYVTNDYSMVCIPICLYESFPFRAAETTLHYAIPCFIIIIFSLGLLFRVLWQKYRARQQILWRRHRKMTIQLLSIACLYLLVAVPWAIMIFLRICGLSPDIAAEFENLTLYVSYYIEIFFPFVACLSLPELRNKVKKFLHLTKLQRSVGPVPLVQRDENKHTMSLATPAGV